MHLNTNILFINIYLKRIHTNENKQIITSIDKNNSIKPM